MHNDSTAQSFGLYIRAQREAREWSVRELARRAEVSNGTVSLIERGESVPETDTALKLARALGLDEFHTLRLLAESQGGSVVAPNLDPETAYIARQLMELPPDLREKAIDAVSGVVDSFMKVAEQRGDGAAKSAGKSGE